MFGHSNLNSQQYQSRLTNQKCAPCLSLYLVS